MHSPRAAVVSLELLLDPDLEARIRAQWDALAGAGFSSLAAHSSIPPLTRAQLDAAIALPLDLEIGDPILFGEGERRVLVRSVVPSPSLLELHAALHTLIGDGADDAPHTRPGEWVPHITLARRIRVADIPQALRLVNDAHTSSPAAATATHLRRWDAESATITELV
jgi:2'-5' RNA ligase